MTEVPELSSEMALQTLLQLRQEKSLREERKKQSRPGGLLEFVRYFWKTVEPETRLVEGWLLEAICQHLEAVSFGKITRLLINVPPGDESMHRPGDVVAERPGWARHERRKHL